MAKEWFAYRNLAKISFIERGRRPKSDFLGEFFDSWADAYEAVNRDAVARLRAARKAVTSAERHMQKVNAMRKPGKATEKDNDNL